MSLFYEERPSDSPYIESITRGQTLCADSVIRPAESRWHMVIVRQQDATRLLIVGPWTTAGVTSYTAGAELLWIRFSLGTFMPHVGTRQFLDVETILPRAAAQSFWLKQAAWQFPSYENVETFVSRLVREDVLVRDPVITAAIEQQPHDLASRTVRDRFLRATGQTHSHIRQLERAQMAAALLRQGVSIPDTMYEAGYFDQPHLTRSLKRFVGYTPAQIVRMSQPTCQFIQDSDLPLGYHKGVPINT